MCSQLLKSGLLSSLEEEKDSIVFDAINEAIKYFDEDKGSFKPLFSKITVNITLRYINQFSKDALSNYISFDENIKIADEIVFKDSIINGIGDNQTKLIKNEMEVIRKYYKGHYRRRIERMVTMRNDGFTFAEIGVRYQMSDKAVRAIFYRLKLKMAKEK